MAVMDLEENDEDEHLVPIFYDVKKSIKNIETWPKKKQGYRDLGSFCIFMVLYIVMLSMQLQVGNSYGIDAAFRTFLSNNIKSVYTQADFWNYLLVPGTGSTPDTGILPILFVNQWYNGNIYSTSEQGYILDYNKLVGGVLILQTRGIVTSDGCTSSLGPSAYQDYYPECYSQDTDTAPFNTTTNPLTSPSFVYNTTYGGYVAFFGVAQGHDKNIQTATLLQQELWTDKGTRTITIKFAFYNGILGLFSFCAIQFIFDVGGIFTNGNSITIQSINMEPYRSATDFVRLAIEIVFMIWLSQQAFYYIKSSYDMTMEIDKVRGVPKGFGALLNLWTAVDLCNISLFFIYIGFRCYILWLIYSNPIQVPTNQYEPILETISLVQDSQLVINFLNIFVALIRFFRFYQFQAKLSVLNKTFSHAFVDLYHFVIMFAVIFGGYGVMGHILFGPSVKDYSSIGLSLQTLWQTLLGAFNYQEIEYVNPDMAAVFFITFMFLVVIVLVNILLAILIDAYTKATQDQEGMTILNEIGKGVIKGINSMRGKNRLFNDDHVVQALKKLQEKGNARVTANDLGIIIAKTISHHNSSLMSDIVQDHPLLDMVEITETDPDKVRQLSGYPLELIDNVESVLRENTYLRHRIHADVS